MAILTNKELAELRKNLAGKSVSVSWTKPTVNVVLQAIEDYSETTAKEALDEVIETAAPGVFTSDQKSLIKALYISQKARRMGV